MRTPLLIEGLPARKSAETIDVLPALGQHSDTVPPPRRKTRDPIGLSSHDLARSSDEKSKTDSSETVGKSAVRNALGNLKKSLSGLVKLRFSKPDIEILPTRLPARKTRRLGVAGTAAFPKYSSFSPKDEKLAAIHKQAAFLKSSGVTSPVHIVRRPDGEHHITTRTPKSAGHKVVHTYEAKFARRPLLAEAIPGVGHPIASPALRLAAIRGSEKAVERNQQAIKSFETARHNLMRREGKPFEPVKVVSGNLGQPGGEVKVPADHPEAARRAADAAAKLRADMRSRAAAHAQRLAKAGKTPFSPARKIQVAGCTYERQPMLAEGLPLPGQTIGGGIAPAGATTTANVGYMTTDGKFPFYGMRTLRAMERNSMAQQRCYKKAGTNMRKLVRCDEVPVKTGGALALISRKGKSS